MLQFMCRCAAHLSHLSHLSYLSHLSALSFAPRVSLPGAAAVHSLSTRDPVIPDCYALGVILRSLLAVNLVVLAVSLVRSAHLSLGLAQFVESSIVTEMACMSSLVVLGALRRRLRHAALWIQRAACAVVPALVTAAILQFLSSSAWLAGSFREQVLLQAAAGAALLGILLQHYFELRSRAFSPALLEARMQALQARIRPHFLFNSLNAVLSLIRSEPQRAEAALEDLADLFRVLMRDPRSMTSLRDELCLCKQYLSIEQIRLGDRLRVLGDRWLA